MSMTWPIKVEKNCTECNVKFVRCSTIDHSAPSLSEMLTYAVEDAKFPSTESKCTGNNSN